MVMSTFSPFELLQVSRMPPYSETHSSRPHLAWNVDGIRVQRISVGISNRLASAEGNRCIIAIGVILGARKRMGELMDDRCGEILSVAGLGDGGENLIRKRADGNDRETGDGVGEHIAAAVSVGVGVAVQGHGAGGGAAGLAGHGGEDAGDTAPGGGCSGSVVGIERGGAAGSGGGASGVRQADGIGQGGASGGTNRACTAGGKNDALVKCIAVEFNFSVAASFICAAGSDAS